MVFAVKDHVELEQPLAFSISTVLPNLLALASLPYRRWRQTDGL
jgi:hypothetical protein